MGTYKRINMNITDEMISEINEAVKVHGAPDVARSLGYRAKFCVDATRRITNKKTRSIPSWRWESFKEIHGD